MGEKQAQDCVTDRQCLPMLGQAVFGEMLGPSAFPVQVSTSFTGFLEFRSRISGSHVATERPQALELPFAPRMRMDQMLPVNVETPDVE
jgi:hypothetical protein